MKKERLLELAGIQRDLNEGKYTPDAVKFLQCRDTVALSEEANELGELQEALFFDNGVLVKKEDAASAQKLIDKIHEYLDDLGDEK